MDLLAENIGYMSWFISVVIAGIGINLIAHYFRKYLDKVWMRLSVRYKTRTETKKRERLARIEELAQDPHGQILQGLAINKIRLSQIWYLCVCIIFCIVAGIIGRMHVYYIANANTSVILALILKFSLAVCGLFVFLSMSIVLADETRLFNEIDILGEARKSSIKQSGATSDSTQR